MRVVSLAVGIVLAFGLGAWGLSRLLPQDTPTWVGLALTMVWLFLLIYSATQMSSNPTDAIKDQRRLLAYGLLTAVLFASFLVPVLLFQLPVPRWVSEIVMLVIAAAVFQFSRYMNRRKLQKPQ